ncbi:hypothetical protein O6H91_Y521100 [Diphasiastrum complanatum]|nr:hypothetical protein O6H91_Y521100 [Diphasiastrum complanatum]
MGSLMPANSVVIGIGLREWICWLLDQLQHMHVVPLTYSATLAGCNSCHLLILLVGAKLQHVIATLALESAGIQGRYDPQIRPRDDLFWLNRPQMMLSLIHFILFQNSFELATFLWALWQFGTRHCFLRKHYLVYGRLISGLVVQVFCSYSTLPLYALVTQMGSTYKKAIFKEGVLESLHGWRKKAHKKSKAWGSP